MTTDLRTQVVEAMARATCVEPTSCGAHLEEAETALGAALDVLGDEFDKEFKPGSLAESDSYAIARLLVVLRDSGKP